MEKRTDHNPANKVQVFLNTMQLAERCKRSARTIQYWRKKLQGPEYITNGHRYFYRIEDVEKWEREQKEKKDWLSPMEIARKYNLRIGRIRYFQAKTETLDGNRNRRRNGDEKYDVYNGNDPGDRENDAGEEQKDIGDQQLKRKISAEKGKTK